VPIEEGLKGNIFLQMLLLYTWKCLEQLYKRSIGLVVKVSASQTRDYGFDPYSGHGHVPSYDTSTGSFQEADSKMINISCNNLFRSRASIFTLKMQTSLVKLVY
jgi:hypothetical protein